MDHRGLIGSNETIEFPRPLKEPTHTTGRSRQADLKADGGWNRARITEATEGLIGLNGCAGVLQVGELDVFGTVLNGKPPHIGQITRYPRLRAALGLLKRDQVRVFVKDAIGLKDDPDGSVSNFSVRETPQIFSEFLGAGAENRFGARQRDTADEKYRP